MSQLRTVDDYTEAELRAWAEALVPVGSPQAAAVLKLFDSRDAARRVSLALADRVFAQVEILRRRAGAKPTSDSPPAR